MQLVKIGRMQWKAQPSAGTRWKVNYTAYSGLGTCCKCISNTKTRPGRFRPHTSDRRKVGHPFFIQFQNPHRRLRKFTFGCVRISNSQPYAFVREGTTMQISFLRHRLVSHLYKMTMQWNRSMSWLSRKYQVFGDTLTISSQLPGSTENCEAGKECKSR